MSQEKWARFDLRSLALFRIALGLVLIIDVGTRLGHLSEFYTDQGVLPRLLFSRSEFAHQWLCFHLGVGHWVGIFLLLMLQAGLGLGLFLGWRTRLMTVGSWFLFNSLLVRNPMVNDRGDLELSLLLFWSFFLPLGARWSLDARAGRGAFGNEEGLPVAAYLLQLAQIYIFAAFLKYGDFWLVRGDGFYHSLQSPLFAGTLAGYLARVPEVVLKAMNYAVVAGELFAGLLLLTPFQPRLLRAVAFWLLLSFHLGVFLLFKLGLFPLIGLIALLPLLSDDWWSRRPLSALERFLDNATGSRPGVSGPLPRALKPILVGCMGLALLSNLAARPEGPAFQRPGFLVGLSQALRLEQHWDLFSPIPPYNGHFQILSMPEGEILLEIPSNEHSFPSHRVKMMMIASLYQRFALIRPGLARILAPPESGHILYRFQVRLVDRDGLHRDPENWVLWHGVT